MLVAVAAASGFSFAELSLAAAAPVSGPQPGDERVEQESTRERAARANGDSTTERQRRLSSRQAFRGLSPAEALAIAEARHPEFVVLPAWRAFQVPLGHEVADFENDFMARITAPDGSDGQIVTSNVPMRAIGRDGTKRPVDLSLESDGDAFRAVNPLADIRLSKQLRAGLRLLESGLVVRPVVDEEPDPRLSGDTLFYASALTDTDVLVQPSVKGFAIHLHLRSALSPERFALDLYAPDDLTLDADYEKRAIAVRRGDDVIASITAPLAVDADGRRVELSWRLEDDQLVIDVPHRDRDYAYPLLVDPEVTQSFEWERYTAARETFAGWQYSYSGSSFQTLSFAGESPDWLGSGLFIRNLQWGMGSAALDFDAGNAGWWSWGPLGFARLPQVEWNLADQDYVDDTCTELGIAGPSGWRSRAWDRCDVYRGQYGRSFSGQIGDQALFKLRATTSENKPYFVSQVGVVYLHLNDPDPPEVASGLPSGWVNWTDTKTQLDFWAIDPSLGISSMTLSAPGWSGATIGPEIGHPERCGRTYMCPRAHVTTGNGTSSQNVTLQNMPEGINTIQVIARDAAGNQRAAAGTASAVGTAVLTGAGLRGEYYDNMDFTARAATRLDPQINFDWLGSPATGVGADTFTVRWSGYVTAPTTGQYSFQTSVDDGVRLWVGDLKNPLINAWRTGAEQAFSATKSLTQGVRYRIVMEFQESGGPAVARLRWRTPGTSTYVAIPSSRLSPPGGWQLKLDRTPPTVAVTGALRDLEGRIDTSGNDLYPVRIDARDGVENGMPAQRRSGVKDVAIFIDGVEEYRVLSEETCVDSCALLVDEFVLDTDWLSEGEHTIKVVVRDRLDRQAAPVEWKITVPRDNHYGGELDAWRAEVEQEVDARLPLVSLTRPMPVPPADWRNPRACESSEESLHDCYAHVMQWGNDVRKWLEENLPLGTTDDLPDPPTFEYSLGPDSARKLTHRLRDQFILAERAVAQPTVTVNVALGFHAPVDASALSALVPLSAVQPGVALTGVYDPGFADLQGSMSSGTVAVLETAIDGFYAKQLEVINRNITELEQETPQDTEEAEDIAAALAEAQAFKAHLESDGAFIKGVALQLPLPELFTILSDEATPVKEVRLLPNDPTALPLDGGAALETMATNKGVAVNAARMYGSSSATASVRTATASSRVEETCYDRRQDLSGMPRSVLDPNPAYWAPSRHKADSDVLLEPQRDDTHLKEHRLRFRWQTENGLSWLCADVPGDRNIEIEARVYPNDDERWSTNWEAQSAYKYTQHNFPEGDIHQDDIAAGQQPDGSPDFTPQRYPDFSVFPSAARGLRYRKLYRVDFTTNEGNFDSGRVIYSAQPTHYAEDDYEKRYCSLRSGDYKSCLFPELSICYNTEPLSSHPVHRRVAWASIVGTAYSIRRADRDPRYTDQIVFEGHHQVMAHCDPKPPGADEP